MDIVINALWLTLSVLFYGTCIFLFIMLIIKIEEKANMFWSIVAIFILFFVFAILAQMM